MIPNEERLHYFAVKKLSALVRGITPKYHCDFYCLNCFHSFATKNERESHKKVYENKDFRNIIMPSEDTKTSEDTKKSDKAPFIVYKDLESLIQKIGGCKNNPENSSATKVGEHISSGFHMPTRPPFKNIEKKNDVYRGKDYMKKFCESLGEHAMKIIIFKKMK